VGLAQLAFRGPLAAWALVTRAERRAFAYRAAAEAAGKVLWFPLFHPRFYGASQIAPAPAGART
jgi:hypothetical protein